MGMVLAAMLWGGMANAAEARPYSLAPMLEKVTPGVVNIATEGRVRSRTHIPGDPRFQWFFGSPLRPPTERKFQSLGSGVIVNAERGAGIDESSCD